MISVIISTYNRPEQLKKAIESVLAQSYQDFEIIVVHDDPKEKQVSSLDNKNRIREYWLDHFGNDTRPKNYGIKQAHGDLIAFLDDDNTFRPDHLQVLYNAIQEEPTLDLVYGDRWLIDEEGRLQSQVGMSSDFSLSLLLKRNYIDTSDVLIRREALYKVGGFDERHKKYVDWNLWLRMAKAGCKFRHILMVITDYHIHNDMKSATKHTENEKLYMDWYGQQAFIPDWSKIKKNNPGDFGQYELEVRLPFLGEVKEPRVAVFSLVYDRHESAKKSLDSIYKTADYPFDHVMVAQTPEDAEFIEKYAKANGIEMEVVENA